MVSPHNDSHTDSHNDSCCFNYVHPASDLNMRVSDPIFPSFKPPLIVIIFLIYIFMIHLEFLLNNG
jgi:hypothetical protein